MGILQTVATVQSSSYNCGSYGEDAYSSECTVTWDGSNPGGVPIPRTENTQTDGTTNNSKLPVEVADAPTGNTDVTPGIITKSPRSDIETTTTQEPPDDSTSPLEMIESTPYVVLVPMILGMAIMLSLLFIVIRHLIRKVKRSV